MAEIQRQLRALWRRRFIRRVSVAMLGIVGFLLWIMVALFACDFLFDMDVPQRAVAVGIAAVALAWAFRTFCQPWLIVREDPLQVALHVERQESIDSDLVAALQFAERGSSAAGSPCLQSAVVQQVRGMARLDPGTAPWDPVLARRFVWLLLTIGFVGIVASTHLAHTQAFLARLILQPASYPTATEIDAVMVASGNHVAVLNSLRDTPEVSVVEQRAVEFWILAGGHFPSQGRLELKTIKGGQRRTVDLVRVPHDLRVERLEQALEDLQRLATDPWNALDETAWRRLLLPDAADILTHLDANPAPSDTRALLRGELSAVIQALRSGQDPPAAYRGEVDQLTDSVHFAPRLGDARVEAGLIKVLREPIVELRGQVRPPKYTRLDLQEIATGDLQLDVLQGSTITLQAICLNKQLSAATLVVYGENTIETFPLLADDATRREWQFEEIPATLSEVRDEFTFELLVTDVDGLAGPKPLRGGIRLLADESPSGSLSSLHTAVTPTGRPTVQYEVQDDFAIAKLQLRITFEAGTAVNERIFADGKEATILKLPLPPSGLTDFPHLGECVVDLSTFELIAGDRINLALEIEDDRGSWPGARSRAAPLYWEVGDEATVLSSVVELDQDIERRLTEIIEQQLKVRSTP